MRMKEILSPSKSFSRSQSLCKGRERHEPWMDPACATPVRVPAGEEDDRLPTRPPAEAHNLGRACGRGGMRSTGDPFTLADQGPTPLWGDKRSERRPQTVAFHPLGMSSDMKFDSKGVSYKLLIPNLNKKVDQVVARLDETRGPQDPVVRWSKPRFEKTQDDAACYRDMRGAFSEIDKEERPRSVKPFIERAHFLIPSQVRFNRSLTAPTPFFQDPPRTAPLPVSSVRSIASSCSQDHFPVPKSCVPDLIDMLASRPAGFALQP